MLTSAGVERNPATGAETPALNGGDAGWRQSASSSRARSSSPPSLPSFFSPYLVRSLGRSTFAPLVSASIVAPAKLARPYRFLRLRGKKKMLTVRKRYRLLSLIVFHFYARLISKYASYLGISWNNKIYIYIYISWNSITCTYTCTYIFIIKSLSICINRNRKIYHVRHYTYAVEEFC